MPPFSIEHSNDRDAACVCVRGDVDIRTALGLRDALRTAEHDERNVIVDLCAVELVDAAGIGVLVRYGKGMRHRGRRLLVVCPPGDVRRLLELCTLTRRVGVHGTREEALAAAAEATSRV